MKFISDNMQDDNGQPIINFKTGISLNDLLISQLLEMKLINLKVNFRKMAFRLLRPIRNQEQFGGVIAGDASDTACFSYSLQGQLFTSQTKFEEIL